MALNRWVLIALAMLSFAAGRRLAYDDDEFQHARMSKLIGQGQVPHRDFYEHHLPLYHLIHAPHMRNAEGPGPLFRLRALSTLCFVLSMGLGARILTLRIQAPESSTTSPEGAPDTSPGQRPVMQGKETEKGLKDRPIGDETWSGPSDQLPNGDRRPGAMPRAGIGRPFRAGVGPTPSRGSDLCFSAVLLWIGLSPIVFLKMLEARPETLSVLLSMVSLWLLSGSKPRPGLAGVAAACMVLASQKFLFLGVGLFGVCALELRWRGLIRFCLCGLVPAVLTLLGLILTDSLAPAWEHLVVMNTGWKESFSPAMYGGLLWRTSGLACVLAVFGVLQKQDSNTRWAAVILLTAGLLGVFMVPIPYRQTFLMLIPGWLLALSLGWNAVIDLLPESSRTLAAYLLIPIGLLPAVANLQEELSFTLEEDRQQMEAVAAVTEGAVFDARGLLWDRPHLGFYPWLHHGLRMMLDPEDYSRDTIAALTEDGFPPYLEDYRAAEYPPQLQTFLAENYLETDIPNLHRFGFRMNRSRLMGRGMELDIPIAGRWRLEGQGGQILVNGTAVPFGTVLELPKGPSRIQAKGFVRNPRLLLMEGKTSNSQPASGGQAFDLQHPTGGTMSWAFNVECSMLDVHSMHGITYEQHARMEATP